MVKLDTAAKRHSWTADSQVSKEREKLWWFIKGMFIWRRASPLGKASPSERVEFHLVFRWEFSGPSSRTGSSAHEL